jgi:GT2 family glycosyltransferase
MSLTSLRTLPDCLSGPTPIAVRAIDLEGTSGHLQLPLSASGAPYRTLLALIRRNGMPQGWATVDAPRDGHVRVDAMTSAVEQAIGDGGSPAASAGVPDCVGGSPETLRNASPEPLLTVVIATCADVASTLRCVAAVTESDTGLCEIVVVENRPVGSTVGRALEEHFGGDPRIRCVEESRPGLSSARNAGLREAQGALIAFTDDDVVVDPSWIRSIRDAFLAWPQVGCVTGLIVPLELETPAQLLIERFASYAKGFAPRIYSTGCPPPDQPLFPYAAGHFGSGANVAFRTDLIRGLGGFDPMLGTGTPARGCEDLDIFIRLLQAGNSLAYEPRAMVWHRHPDTEAGLRRRTFDYGAALGAMLTKQLVSGPTRRRIASLAPRGVRYFLSPASRKNAARGRGFPSTLIALEIAGLLYGPLAYLKSVLLRRRR